MESLRDIRQNIKAIKSTQQIMQTMKMISSARIRKAQDAMDAARPFAKKMLQMVDDLKQDILAMPEPEDEKAGPDAFSSTKPGTPAKSASWLLRATKAWRVRSTRSFCAACCNF